MFDMMGCGRKVVAGGRFDLRLGVFQRFFKICSLLRQENSRFPASFPVSWAFLTCFFDFCSLFLEKEGVRNK